MTMSAARVSSTIRRRPAPLGDRVMNRLVNPVTRVLLRSPLHRVLSKSTALVTYTGRRSGATRTVPVNYLRVGDDWLVVTSLRRRQWWRSLQSGAPVGVRLAGVDRTGSAMVLDLGIAARATLVAPGRAEDTVVIAIDLDGGHSGRLGS